MEHTPRTRMLVNPQSSSLGAPNPCDAGARTRMTMPSRRRALLAIGGVLVPGAHVGAPRTQAPSTVAVPWSPPCPDPLLQSAIAAVAQPSGSVSVAVHHLATGQGAAIDADVIAPPASLFKLGIMVAVMRDLDAGRLSAEMTLDILEGDWAPGAGVLQDRIGQAVTVAEALRLMIGISDNVAAFVLLRAIGSQRLNDCTASLGMARTRFYVDERPDETSAGDVATILARIATGEAAGPTSTRAMLDLLSQRQPAAWIRQALGDRVPVAHKSGQLTGVRNDAAIVPTPAGPYVVAVLTHGLSNDAAGERYVIHMARAIDHHLAGER